MSNLPLNINLTQIFLHLLNFLILFAILYFLLYKPVKNFMEKREKTYRDMDDEARDNLKASEEKKAQYDTHFLHGITSFIRFLEMRSFFSHFLSRSV